jgi:membrane fusion protein, multidrug efflux system
MTQAPTARLRATLGSFALASAALAGTAAAQQPGGASPPAVTVFKVEQRDVTPSTSFTGRIEAKDKVDLRARVEGFLEQQLFTEGQSVAAGDLLFVIEKAPYQAEIENVEAAIARAQATLDRAELERRRQAQLVKKQAAAQAKLDDDAAAAGGARADLRRQQANLTTAELDLGYTEIRAPIAGRIGRSNFAVGNFVGPQSGTLATVVSQDPMYVTFR